MNFKRKQTKGRSAKHYKEWYDETKQYRVSWRNEAFGVEVPSGYFACVRCSRPGGEYWGFVGRRGLYRTLTSAMDACDRNREIWDKFLAIDGKAKVRQLKELKEHAIFGSGNSSYSMMAELPVWMTTKAPQRLLELLCGKDQSDPTETSNPSDGINSNEPESSDSPAKCAKAAVKGRRKKSTKRTTKHTTKRSPNGKKSAKKHSTNSRKKKSKPSKG